MYVSEKLDLGFALRIHGLTMSNNNYVELTPFIEPVFVLKTGTSSARLVLQFGTSFRTKYPKPRTEHRFFIINCGLEMNIGELAKHMKKRK